MDRHALNSAIDSLNYLTVDRLKWILRAINQHHRWGSHPTHKLSGLKADLLARVKITFISAFNENDTPKFDALKEMVIDSLELSKPAHAAASHAHAPPPQTAYQREHARIVAQAAQQRDAAAARIAQQQRAVIEQERQVRMQNQQHYTPAHPGAPPPAQAPAAGPLPAPRWGPSGTMTAAAANAPKIGGPSNGINHPAAAPRVDTLPIRFRTNPFYRIEKSLSGLAICVRAGQGDRKSVHANFALTEPQRALLIAAAGNPTAPQYQVRLFSTNEEHFNQSRPAASQNPVPMDFPPIVEVRLNNSLVNANMKGIKKQIGSAPPADLSATKALNGSLALNLAPGHINKLEIVYGNTEKKYFLIVYLIETSSVKTLFTKLKTTKVRTKEEVIASIIKQNSDPDLEASSMGLSLKDPLTLARIKVPIRSISCNHVSCFDAETFLMINEQTPSWKCPTCNNVLRYEDLTVDGYLQDILKLCPSSVDAVTVEPNGTWRSTDNLHGTAPPRPSRAGTEDSLNTANEKGKAKATDQDALTIDSDDDDRPLIRNRPLQLEISRPNSRASTEVPKRSETIDLTLSDSEEEEDEDDYVLYNARTALPVLPPIAPQAPFDPYVDVRAQYVEQSMENAAAKRQLDEAESNQAKRQREEY